MTNRTRYGIVLAALIAAALACDLPGTHPSTYIVVGPDPAVTVAPDDMKAAGKVIGKRLDAAGLNQGVEVGDTQIKVYYADPDDLDTVTKLSTAPGVLEFFEWETALPPGSAAPEHGAPILTDQDIQSASVSHNTATDKIAISVTFTLDGAKTIADYTSSHVGNILVIAQDGVVLTAPSITAAITGGTAVIEGSFDTDSAALLANELNAGRLPIALQVLSAGSSAP